MQYLLGFKFSSFFFIHLQLLFLLFSFKRNTVNGYWAVGHLMHLCACAYELHFMRLNTRNLSKWYTVIVTQWINPKLAYVFIKPSIMHPVYCSICKYLCVCVLYINNNNRHNKRVFFLYFFFILFFILFYSSPCFFSSSFFFLVLYSRLLCSALLSFYISFSCFKLLF